MKKRWPIAAVALLVLISAAGFAFFKASAPGEKMTTLAGKFIEQLDEKEKAVAVMPYDTPKRVDWHFIPKDHRKGLQIKHMNKKQRQAAHNLLQAALSKMGYDKSVRIMQLEAVLAALEGDKPGGNIRDPERYYVTLFGEPKADSRWGFSFEGHHLSLNFVVENNEIIASTPQFFAANPATILNKVEGGPKLGSRVLKVEEASAFALVQSLDKDQAKTGVIADKAPREIRAAGAAQPPQEPAVGIAHDKLNKKQQELLEQVIREYADAMPKNVAAARLEAIEKSGWDKVHFAWAGAAKPGVGHYYRIQGPSFLIEFVNTQPDPAGNPANHIHCVWRDMNGDFALPISAE